jgi:subtilisin family serine protease
MKHLKPFIAVAALATLAALGGYAYSIWPKQAAVEAVPTQTISETQGIGGVASKSDDANGAVASKDSTSDKTDAPTSPATIAPQPFEDVAPRQAEIKRATPVEYDYRALRASNDPLPQPNWLMNTTKAQSAWDRSTGNGAIVAVIDSGFALAHEDLVNQWHQNPGETGMTTLGGRCWTGTSVNKNANNCDDDNNGYRDDWRGWDFVGVNNNPQAGETNPNGAGVAHGTEVAGLAGATGNNGVGTTGPSWNNRLMPLQALDDNGSGYTSSVAAAVYYAVDNGAAVINLSLGGTTNDSTLANAIRYAYERGVVVVAAAGNCGTGTEQGCDPSKPGAMSYPALNPHVIAVGATTSTNARAGFGSYGPGLDVSAPGSGTLVSPMWRSTNQTSAYATSLYGTSFASPIVAGYVGLLKSIRPASSVDDITAIVDATASKPGMSGNLYSTQLGHGVIDMDAGLRVAASLNDSDEVPQLMQAGGTTSEHSFALGMTLASGCETQAGMYCTVWAKDSSGYDRFLPYNQTDQSGKAGWSWQANWLGGGDWRLWALSGEERSTTPYMLSNK